MLTLKEEALDRTPLRAGFGRYSETVVGHTAERMNELHIVISVYEFMTHTSFLQM